MIARWMMSATLFAALCGIAALAIERALRAFHRPTRTPWAVALACAATWPVLAPLFLHASQASVTMSQPSAVGTALVSSENATWLNFTWLAQLDRTFAYSWGIASTLLVLQMVLAIRTLHRLQRDAPRAVVSGEPVIIDDSIGPAVVGLVHPTIVIPSWLLELDDALRMLVLRHEREHCLARDPGLVWLSVVTTTLLPWNVALWWIAHQLRFAIEMDCDSRTMRNNGDRTQYARLLLLIAQRTSSARFVPRLAISQSQLGRRLVAMHSTPVRHPARRAALAGTIATLAIAAACSPRLASNFTAPAPEVATAEPMIVIPPITPNNGKPVSIPSTTPFFEFQVERAVAMRAGFVGPLYPKRLRDAKVEGTVLAQFVVDTTGTPEPNTFKVLQSSNRLFAEAVRDALAQMQFTPALVGGRPVKQLLQQPFMFALRKHK